ncbi:hypothetical protein HDU76_009163, partial [Blyttiomyces sp. JEL0837]
MGLLHPVYNNVAKIGTDNAPIFLCSVQVADKEFLGETWHRTIQAAKNEAARVAIQSLGLAAAVPPSTYLSNLYQLCQKANWNRPVFQQIDRKGPDHRPTFLFQVQILGSVYIGESYCNTSQLAKAEAARVAMESLKNTPPEPLLRPLLPPSTSTTTPLAITSAPTPLAITGLSHPTPTTIAVPIRQPSTAVAVPLTQPSARPISEKLLMAANQFSQPGSSSVSGVSIPLGQPLLSASADGRRSPTALIKEVEPGKRALETAAEDSSRK